MNNIQIREFCAQDDEGVRVVSHELHLFLRKFYKPSLAAKPIGSGDVPFIRIVALVDNQIVGTATYEVDQNSLYFGSLGVLERYRKKGIARLLIKYIEDRAKDFGFSKLVAATMEMTGNVPFFIKVGFKIVSRELTHKFVSIDGQPVIEVFFEKDVNLIKD